MATPATISADDIKWQQAQEALGHDLNIYEGDDGDPVIGTITWKIVKDFHATHHYWVGWGEFLAGLKTDRSFLNLFAYHHINGFCSLEDGKGYPPIPRRRPERGEIVALPVMRLGYDRKDGSYELLGMNQTVTGYETHMPVYMSHIEEYAQTRVKDLLDSLEGIAGAVTIALTQNALTTIHASYVVEITGCMDALATERDHIIEKEFADWLFTEKLDDYCQREASFYDKEAC